MMLACRRLAPLLGLLLGLSFSSCHDKPKTIAGMIRMSPELQKTVSPSAVIYVMARHPGEAGGPPVAVKRIVQPFSFPMAYTLSAENAMIPEIPLEGQLTLNARLSQSGSATPASPGDIETPGASQPVEVGSQGLDIELSQVRK